MATLKACKTCTHLGINWNTANTFMHSVCRKANVGEATETAAVKCVCEWVHKGTKPRGCPGWLSRKEA